MITAVLHGAIKPAWKLHGACVLVIGSPSNNFRLGLRQGLATFHGHDRCNVILMLEDLVMPPRLGSGVNEVVKIRGNKGRQHEHHHDTVTGKARNL